MPLDTAYNPYAVPEDLASLIDAMDLRGNVRELVDDGYTVIQDPVAHALTDRVREAILRLSDETEGGPLKSRGAGLLLGRDPVFTEAVLIPKLLVMAEYLLGRGMLISQLVGSIRRQDGAPLGLHADNSWFPEPFPSWEIMCTACWVTDEFTADSGPTLIMPGTHKERRHPPRDVRKVLQGAQPIIAPKGSLCLWNGSVWHGNYSRQIPGERVVLISPILASASRRWRTIVTLTTHGWPTSHHRWRTCSAASCSSDLPLRKAGGSILCACRRPIAPSMDPKDTERTGFR
jgi:hypothetical protein